MAKNKFRISLRYIPRAINVLVSNFIFYPINLAETLIYKRRIKRTTIDKAPVFVLGHWRSGTTYMHNLISRDKQFACPSTYQCLMPGIFLIGGIFLKRILNSLLPDKRPVDNVKLGGDWPQEEEFAMNILCPQSYYLALCFPKKIKQFFNDYGTLESGERQNWEKEFSFFIKKVSYAENGKQMVLKNPTNTVRIKALIGIYPNAKFIYLKRDREEVLNSTFNLYRKMLDLYSFQEFSDEEIENNLFWLHQRTIEEYESQKRCIEKGNLIEVSYSDLVKEPFEQMRRIYSELALEGFENAQTNIQEYIEEQRQYKPNTKKFLKTNKH